MRRLSQPVAVFHLLINLYPLVWRVVALVAETLSIIVTKKSGFVDLSAARSMEY